MAMMTRILRIFRNRRCLKVSVAAQLIIGIIIIGGYLTITAMLKLKPETSGKSMDHGINSQQQKYPPTPSREMLKSPTSVLEKLKSPMPTPRTPKFTAPTPTPVPKLKSPTATSRTPTSRTPSPTPLPEKLQSPTPTPTQVPVPKKVEKCPRHFTHHNGHQCPPVTEPDFEGTVTPFYIYGYSAFQDMFIKTPFVKVIFYCVCPEKPNFECDIQFAGSKDYVRGRAPHISGSASPFDTNEYGVINNALLMCPYPDSMNKKPVPVATSIRILINDTVVMTLPVEKLPWQNKRKSLAMCLPRVYSTPYCKDCVGMNYTYHLPEWIEMQRIMGVDTIFAYNQSMNEDASRIFQYYADQGFVEILSHKPIRNETYMPTSMGVTDCMTRNKYAYDYVIVLDMDEFIFSHKYDTYQEMIAAYLHKSNYKQLTFRTTFFYTNDRRAAAEDYLLTMSYHDYQYLDDDHAGKSITDPRFCYNIVIPHECYFMQKSTVIVDLDVAMVHHYKGCSRKSLGGREICEKDKNKQWPRTNVTEKYHARLKQAVEKTFHDLKLWGF